MSEAQPWTVEHLRFDGVWRPEPWASDTNWRAVRYSTEWDGKRRRARRDMDEAAFKRRQQAQARCNELNATRMAVSPGGEAQKSLI